MDQILEQLGINQTLFIQLGVFALMYLLLSATFFNPFLRLISNRNEKTTTDREAAKQLMVQAEQKMDFYKKTLATERERLTAERAQVLLEIQKAESDLLQKSRDEAKKIAQDAAILYQKNYMEISEKLSGEIEVISKEVIKKLLFRKTG